MIKNKPSLIMPTQIFFGSKCPNCQFGPGDFEWKPIFLTIQTIVWPTTELSQHGKICLDGARKIEYTQILALSPLSDHPQFGHFDQNIFW